MNGRTLGLALASAALFAAPGRAAAHWCDDLWMSNYNLVIRPASDTVSVPASGSATLELYVQNNMGYPLKNFTLTATATGYTVGVVRAAPKVAGFLMPGERQKHTLTLSKAGGASLAVADLAFAVVFGEGSQSWNYPSSGGRAAMLRKTDGTLVPLKPYPGVTSASRVSDGNAQSAHLLFSSQADYDDLGGALDALMKQYCVGRPGWDHNNYTGPTAGLCPTPSDASTTHCSTAAPSSDGTKWDWQRLWSAQELAYRKASLGARLPALRKGLQCGWADPNFAFKAFAGFALGYLGEDAAARTFLTGVIGAGTAQEKAVAKASLLLMRSAADAAAYHADVAACASDADPYVASVCQAALGIVDKDDATVTGKLLPRVSWTEPDTAANGNGFFQSHLLALVAWDRRQWAPNAADTGAVCFYESCTAPDTTPPSAPGTTACSASAGGAVRVSWPQVTRDQLGNLEVGAVSYKVYYGAQARPATAASPRDFSYDHADPTGGLSLSEPASGAPAFDGTRPTYFAVAAVDAAGNVGNFSNEVSCTALYAPVARLACDKTSGLAPLAVSCSAAGSTDANGAADLASYTFLLDGAQVQAGSSTTWAGSLAAGGHSLQVTIADRGGLTSQAAQALSVTAPVNQPPTARAVASPASGVAPLTVQLSSAGSSDPEGTALTYAWDFGDGQTSTAASPQHVFQAAGSYGVRLTVTDGGSPKLSATAVAGVAVGAAVNHPPDLSTASASPANGDVPLTVHFDASGVTDPDGSPFTVSWAFGDGATASTARADHVYASAGSYAAVLTVQDQGAPAIAAVTRGFAIAAATATLPDTTPPAPPAGVSCGPSPLAAQGRLRAQWAAVTLDAAGKPESVASYRVYSGNQARPDASYVYPQMAQTTSLYLDPAAQLDGTREVYFAVVAVDAAGNASPYSAEVHCAPPYPPAAQLSCAPLAGSAPLAVSCSAAGSSDPNGAADLASYRFTVDGVQAQSGASPSFAATLAAGSHPVAVVVADRGGLSSQASVDVTVTAPANRPPLAQAVAAPASGAAPLAVSFSSAGTSDPEGTSLTFSWDFGDGQSSALANPGHTFAAPGSYGVRLTATDSGSPPQSALAVVTVTVRAAGNQPPDVSSASATPLSGAAPLAVHFDATGVTDPDGDRFTVSWTFGDGATSSLASADHRYDSPGSYTATLSAQDSGTPAVAAATRTFAVTVSAPGPVNHPPDCALATIAPASGEAPLRVTLDARGCTDSDGDNLTFLWQVPKPWVAMEAEDTFTTATAEFVFPSAGEYQVTLHAADAAASSLEISRTFTVQVLVPDQGGDGTLKAGVASPFSCSSGGGGLLAAAAALWLWPLLKRRRGRGGSAPGRGPPLRPGPPGGRGA